MSNDLDGAFGTTRRTALWTLISVVAALGAFAWSAVWRDGSMRSWWSDVLVNIGATIALIVPAWFITSRLEERIQRTRDEVRQARVETNAQVDALTTQVGDVERRVAERLADVEQRVAERMQTVYEAFVERFEALSRS